MHVLGSRRALLGARTAGSSDPASRRRARKAPRRNDTHRLHCPDAGCRRGARLHRARHGSSAPALLGCHQPSSRPENKDPARGPECAPGGGLPGVPAAPTPRPGRVPAGTRLPVARASLPPSSDCQRLRPTSGLCRRRLSHADRPRTSSDAPSSDFRASRQEPSSRSDGCHDTARVSSSPKPAAGRFRHPGLGHTNHFRRLRLSFPECFSKKAP